MPNRELLKTSMWLDRRHHARLDEIAAELQITRSRLVREIIKRYLRLASGKDPKVQLTGELITRDSIFD